MHALPHSFLYEWDTLNLGGEGHLASSHGLLIAVLVVATVRPPSRFPCFFASPPPPFPVLPLRSRKFEWTNALAGGRVMSYKMEIFFHRSVVAAACSLTACSTIPLSNVFLYSFRYRSRTVVWSRGPGGSVGGKEVGLTRLSATNWLSPGLGVAEAKRRWTMGERRARRTWR